jgi:hypothetical protein
MSAGVGQMGDTLGFAPIRLIAGFGPIMVTRFGMYT